MSLIHRYKSNGFNIVLDINSGCIHLVDEVTYDVLPYLEEGLGAEAIAEKLENKYNREDIETSVRECNKLKEDGMLFTKDVYENVIEEFSNNRQTVVKHCACTLLMTAIWPAVIVLPKKANIMAEELLCPMKSAKKALDFLIANSGSSKKPGSRFLWRRAADELAGCKRSGKIWQRAGKKLHNKKFRFTLTTTEFF